MSAGQQHVARRVDLEAPAGLDPARIERILDDRGPPSDRPAGLTLPMPGPTLSFCDDLPMEGEPMNDPTGRQEPAIVITELDELLMANDLGSLASRPIEDLRHLRDQLGEIEAGLSFVRRMAQGRLDIVLAEFHGRIQGRPETAHELVDRLPEVLSGQARGGGSPRAVRDVELPSFTDQFLAELDALLHPTDLSTIDQLDADDLDGAAQRLSSYERSLSVKRSEVHRLIDEVQDEIIGRYRSGSVSVDDLLRG